jgi:hypothetical protein
MMMGRAEERMTTLLKSEYAVNGERRRHEFL